MCQDPPDRRRTGAGAAHSDPGPTGEDRSVPPPLLDYAESVFDVAALIPPARVLTYGDIAELLEAGGPRQVGAAMSRAGGAVPWWRVIRSGGYPPRGLARDALAHYQAEDTPLKTRKRARAGDADYAVDLRRARWSPSEEELSVIARARRQQRDGISGSHRRASLRLSAPDDEVEA